MVNLRFLFIYFIALVLIQSCGVKGKPQAPQKPPFIGQGLNAAQFNSRDNKSEKVQK